jgi:hypothetical protein
MSDEPGPDWVWPELEAALGAWYRRARESQFAHYHAANYYAAASRWLGIPSVLLSAVVGTALFATLEQDNIPPVLQVGAGLIALTAAALSALQTFLGYGERAAKHRAAAAAYGAVRREIEQQQVLRPASRADAGSMIETIRHHLDDIGASAPDISSRLWERARIDIAHTSRPEGFRMDHSDEPTTTVHGSTRPTST